MMVTVYRNGCMDGWMDEWRQVGEVEQVNVENHALVVV